MPYVRVDDPLLDQNKPGRSTDWKRIRDNQDYFDSQITAFSKDSSKIRLFSHFDKRHGFATDLACASGATRTEYESDFYLATESNNTWTESMNTATSDTHYLRAFRTGTSGTQLLAGAQAFYFDNRTRPLTYIARCRMSANSADLWLGFSQWQSGSPSTTRPTSGIFMELNGTNWRFTSASNASYTAGTDFTRVAVNTWYEVKILFEDTPSNQARCYLDGVLKETLTTNLPTARVLFGIVGFNLLTGQTFDVDRIEISASGIVDTA